MVDFQCPGSSRFKKPEPEDIVCPHCGSDVEIWTDEINTTCPNCKRIVTRSLAPSCFDWCRYAKKCAGDTIYSTYMKNKTLSMRDVILKEMENYFGEDKKRIDHAKKVLKFAEEILKKEQGDWHIVIPVSILHDIGIKEAKKKYGSSGGSYQEKEGPRIAERILLKFGLKRGDVNEICEIIAHHHSPGEIDTMNFKILYDADTLVNFKDEIKNISRKKLPDIIKRTFFTLTAKRIAEKLYC